MAHGYIHWSYEVSIERKWKNHPDIMETIGNEALRNACVGYSDHEMKHSASKGLLNIPGFQFASPQIDLTAVNQIKSLLEEMGRDVGSAGNHIQKIIKEHEDVWAKQQVIWNKYWKEHAKQIANSMKRVANAYQRAEAVGRYGWTIPIDASLRETVSMFDVINRRSVG